MQIALSEQEIWRGQITYLFNHISTFSFFLAYILQVREKTFTSK